MSNYFKPGGGNKLQPYVPAGNGNKSGEYTNKNKVYELNNNGKNCHIRNVRFGFNFCKSKLVGKVTTTYISGQGVSMPTIGKANSVLKKIINNWIVTERYYNNKGEAYLDIDYTCHGNPSMHPSVPHIHRWTKNEAGILVRGKWEVFQ